MKMKKEIMFRFVENDRLIKWRERLDKLKRDLAKSAQQIIDEKMKRDSRTTRLARTTVLGG